MEKSALYLISADLIKLACVSIVREETLLEINCSHKDIMSIVDALIQINAVNFNGKTIVDN